MAFVPFKCTCIPLVLHVLLNFSPIPCMYGTTMVIPAVVFVIFQSLEDCLWIWVPGCCCFCIQICVVAG